MFSQIPNRCLGQCFKLTYKLNRNIITNVSFKNTDCSEEYLFVLLSVKIPMDGIKFTFTICPGFPTTLPIATFLTVISFTIFGKYLECSNLYYNILKLFSENVCNVSVYQIPPQTIGHLIH